MRGGGKLLAPEKRLYNNKPNAYTLAEIVVVMLIIAVIVGVSIKVTKSRLDNILSYTYYSTYSTLRSVTANMLADYNPDEEIYQAKNNIIRFPFLNLFSDNAAKAETVKIYGCPTYHVWDIWSKSVGVYGSYRGDDRTETDASKLNCGLNSVLDYLRNAKNNVTNENHYMLCSGKRDGNITFGVGPGYTSSDTSKNCTFSCTDTSPQYNRGSCGPMSIITNNLTCNELIYYSFELKGNYCVHEYECPENTYATYSYDSYESSPYRMVKYSCVEYKTCPDGSQVKQEESCPDNSGGGEVDPPVVPTCNITPSDVEVKSQYCQGKEFDSSPDVCGWVDVTPWPPACETGKEWSAEHCQCVAIPATIPKKGANFCELFEQYVNINPSDRTCNGSSVDTSTTEFSDLTPDLILRNGVRLYNVHQDPAIISQLQIIGIDTETAEKDTNQKGYIIYADVDGSKGNSVLWEDVYPFYITLSGRVIPAYDRGANPEGSGGDSENHLQVSVKNETFSANGHRAIKWLSKSVSFKEGACQSGYIDELTDYCNGVSYDSECELNNSNCQLKAIQPLKFF